MAGSGAGGKTIGFIGIGNMGAPMVRCLAKAGFSVLMYDTRADVTAPFAAEGGPFAVARDVAAVGAGAATVVTMLPDSKIVNAVVLGADGRSGLAGAMNAGGIVIDMSSSYPLETVKLGAALAERGLGLVDAPVSGGVPKAITGTLAIMTGGDQALVERVTPVLSAMGQVHRTGGLGSGHAMKALNNYVSAAGLIATAEALVVGQRFGLDGQTMTDVLNASTGRNNTTENKVTRYMLNGAYNSGFALALMEKDVGMARSLAAALGVPASELDFVSQSLGKALAALGKDADHTAVYKFVVDAAGGTAGKS